LIEPKEGKPSQRRYALTPVRLAHRNQRPNRRKTPISRRRTHRPRARRFHTNLPDRRTSPIDDGASPQIIPAGYVSAADSLTGNTTPAGRALNRRGGVPIEPLEGKPK
jgi:hypothetical protein